MKMNNESGRSMVEMLGVLAIIGVLSIGGIAGYTIAMNRYRANEIIDTATKLCVISMTKNATTNNTATATFTDLNITGNVGGCASGISASTTATDGDCTATVTGCSEQAGVKNAVESIMGGTSATVNKVKIVFAGSGQQTETSSGSSGG